MKNWFQGYQDVGNRDDEDDNDGDNDDNGKDEKITSSVAGHSN